MITSIDNFLKMSPDVPQYSRSNKSYLISGANPTYYLDDTGDQEEQVAPLAASVQWRLLDMTFSDDIVDMAESNNDTYDVYAICANSEVFGIDLFAGTATSLGFPSGAAEVAGTAKIVISNDQVYAITRQNTSPVIYKMDTPSGAWTSFGTLVTDGEHFMEPFLNFVALSDEFSKVNKINSDFTVSAGIDLGTGWEVNGLENYNNKYLAVAGSVNSYNQNFLFLWNGIDERYNYSMRMPGRFIDMKVIDSVLYVAVNVPGLGNNSADGKTALYRLQGQRLVEEMTPQYAKIGGPLFNFINKVGMTLRNDDLMIYGESEVGTEEFVLSGGINFQNFCVSSSGFLLGANSSKELYIYDIGHDQYNSILYKSQWVPIQNLTAIDIYYDTPPQSGTDAISTTIYGKGEDIQSGNSTTVLEDITPTSKLNNTRTRLDVKGFTGSKIKIQISTTNSTWRPIIRNIVLLDDRDY